MKKTLLLFCFLAMAFVAMAVDFTYDGVTYTILSEVDKTVSTKDGTFSSPGHKDLTGELKLHDKVPYNGTNYTLTTIGQYSFFLCDGLTGTLTIPNSVTNIGYGAFRACGFTGALTIPESVITIGDYAFYSCSYLNEITIPGTILQIGKRAFASCIFTSSITINNGVEIIEERAFEAANNVQTIEIPESVKTLGDNVFRDCSSLYTVILGKGLNNIGERVFSGCTKLLSVTSLNPTPPVIEGTTFENTTTSSGKLFVPQGSESKYFSANYWLEFKSITAIEVEDDNSTTPGVSPSDITATVLMVPDEDRDFSALLPSGVSVSSWESTDEDVAEVNRRGRVDAWEFGRAYVTAKDAAGNSLALFEVLVCPTVTVEHGSGAIYSHHVVYNSIPTLSLKAGVGYRIAGATHIQNDKSKDIYDNIIDNDGKYVPAEPITANSVINLALEDTKEGPTTGADAVLNDPNIRILVDGHVVNIVGIAPGTVVRMYNLNTIKLFDEPYYPNIEVIDCGVYIIEIEGQPNKYKIVVR